MLKVENLVTEYGAVRAIDGVSFTAAEGKITTVIGANGAGKSTLLRTISGLERAKSGQITWADKSLIGKAPEFIVRSGIAHVPEGHAVISQLTVAENIEMGSLFRRRNFRSDVKLAIEEVYEPFLIQQGFILRTPRGREVTKLAYDHLGLKKTHLWSFIKYWLSNGFNACIGITKEMQIKHKLNSKISQDYG